MYFYLCFGLLFLLFSTAVRTDEDKRSRELTAGLFFFAVFVLTGLRSPSVGNDSMQFYQAYLRIRQIPWADYASERYEWGFFAFCKLLGAFCPHPQTVFLVTSFVFSISVFRFIQRYSHNAALSCLLFLFLNLWAVYLNLMRQILALCIVLYALERLLEGRKLHFCLGVFAASLFHRSAWVCLVMLFLCRRRFSAKAAIAFASVAVFGFWQYERLFNLAVFLLRRYDGYRASEQFGGANYFGMVFNSLVCLAVLLYGALMRRRESFSPQDRPPEILPADFQAYMLLCCLFCYILGMRMYILSRLTPYFTIFYLSWLGKAEPFLKMEEIRLSPPVSGQPESILKRSYPLEPYVIVLISAAYFCTIHFFRPEWQGVVPYRFFWQG